MRRLVGDGVNNRFVTGERLEAMIKVRRSSHPFFSVSSFTEGNTQPHHIWCNRVYGRGLVAVRTQGTFTSWHAIEGSWPTPPWAGFRG
jgi:hypothetical protein